jgi:hypothetical protein
MELELRTISAGRSCIFFDVKDLIYAAGRLAVSVYK